MTSRMTMMTVITAVLSLSELAAAQVSEKPMPVVLVEPEVPNFKNRISAAPLSLLLGIGNFTYERALGDRLSLDLAPSGIYMSYGDDDIYGGALGIGASIYITGSAPRGLKVSASVAPGFVGVNGDSEAFMLFAKATFGYNWIWANGFSIGLAAGVQYIHFEETDTEEVDNPLSGVLPAIDFNIGFAF